jgi:hypothetical protein
MKHQGSDASVSPITIFGSSFALLRTFNCKSLGEGGLRSELHRSGTLEEQHWSNGQGGIRTHDTLAGIPVFETDAFSHSATCPNSGER